MIISKSTTELGFMNEARHKLVTGLLVNPYIFILKSITLLRTTMVFLLAFALRSRCMDFPTVAN
ncbi:hypothetical protein J2T13_004312 [Paenibacillus sp. DS2015]